MSESEREPGSRVGGPDLLLVRAGIEPEHVRDAGLPELDVQPLVLGTEALVPAADVEGEEGRAELECAPQLPDERMGARATFRRARPELERRRSRRVGRVLVTAPGLDRREVREMVEG